MGAMFDHIENQFFRVEYRVNALRISGIIPRGGKNLLADLSNHEPIQTQHGTFRFLGGHRLWYAPEKMPDTYVPDERGLRIEKQDLSVTLETPEEPITGIRKRIKIILAQDSPQAVIEHTLINDGSQPQTIAPWAITQFRPGGTAIMPIRSGDATSALLPDRQLIFWPYAHFHDPRLRVSNKHLFFHGAHIDQAFKVGSYCDQGWLAYVIDGMVFKKTFSAQPSNTYPDRGCNAEIYGCGSFVELESLSPTMPIHPGDHLTHTETWQLLPNIEALDPELGRSIK